MDPGLDPGSPEAALALSSCARVPLRRQLAAQLGAGIRSGEICQGERLPSARRLAARLGVHRHTVAAAYAELHRLGLVRRIPRSGVYAACPMRRAADGVAAAQSLEEELSRLLRSQRRRGRSVREVDRLMTRWVSRSAEPHILVIEPEPALRRLMVAELVGSLPGFRIEGSTVGRVRRNPDSLAGRCLVARSDVVARLPAPDPALADLIVLRTSSPVGCRRAIRALESGQVVSLLTVSRLLRRHARELLASDLDARIGLACPRPERGHEVSQALRVSSLVLVDFVIGRRLGVSDEANGRRGNNRRQPLTRLLRVVRPGWIAHLARYLGVDSTDRRGIG